MLDQSLLAVYQVRRKNATELVGANMHEGVYELVSALHHFVSALQSAFLYSSLHLHLHLHLRVAVAQPRLERR